MRQEFNTTIADAEGVAHEYRTVSFPSSQGANLLLEIAEILGGPIGAALQSLFGAAGAEDAGDIDVDLSSLPEILERMPRLIVKKGGAAFLLRILAHTSRSPEAGSEKWDSINRVDHFDQIYASNYWELISAIRWVLEVNFAPFSADGSPSWSGLLERLSPMIPAIKTKIMPMSAKGVS